ncbi:FHA domain-containing protein [Niallia sp. Krafla_26]|uniref:FHA domain-containing protein n=1 Tax=Niallia sp. Krafla_26 TaxID=3064703 RepID=UPI003D17DC2B
MGITTVKQRRKKYIVENKLTPSESVNEREFKVIAGGMLESLIPMKMEKSRKGFVLKSKIAGMDSLQSYFSEAVSKDMFLDVVSQLIAIVKECERNLMNVNNLMLDDEYIFLDRKTQIVKCVFWPVFKNEHVFEVARFFHDLPFRVVFTKNENHDYITRYLQYFKSHSPFSLKSFEKLIHELLDQKVTNHSQPHTDSTQFGDRQGLSNETIRNVVTIGSQTNSSPNQQTQCPQCGHEKLPNAKYCVSCGSPLYEVEEMQNQVLDISEVLGIKDDLAETTILSEEDFDNGTTVLGADSFEETTFPYLIRERTEEKITVDKPFFRIGKEKSFCDYFVANNNAVSRSHADIITREGRYYIIDHNSTNKTYVDNRVIPVQQEVEIFSGTKVTLANEEFVFYI